MNYCSSSCFKFTKIKDLLEFCRTQDLNQIELSGNLEFDQTTATELIKAKDFFLLIHNYFPTPKEPFVLNMASANNSIRGKSVQHCQQAISLCQKLKIPFYSVHAGFLADLQPDDLGKKQAELPYIDRETGLKLFNDSVDQLLNLKFPLLIENNVNSRENLVKGKNKLYLLAEPEETLQFFKHFNNSYLGLLVDLGHLNVSAQQLGFDKYKYLEILAPWIKAFHLSANNGIEDQGLVFSQDEWFMKTLNKFPNAAKIIEVNTQTNFSDLLNCYQSL